MKQQFSKTWKGSRQPRKQRKYLYNAPLHLKRRLMAACLSDDLRKQLGKRSLPLKKKDVVRIMRGGFKGKTGKVNAVSTKKFSAYIDGIEASRRDGTKVSVPIKSSNLMIIELNSEDSRRLNKNG